jgi:2-methylisocitrate lyase-like PEP mutase family enzyme
MDTAETFHRLHDGPDLLRLANCWDAGSARVIENLGARAVATTSAGVAWSNGYPDGNALPVDRLLASVRAIARVLRVPLSVDIEGGYSDEPETVGMTVAALLEAGAVGINIEDGRRPPELLAAKIERAKRAAQGVGVNLFVNARTDVYLHGLVPESLRIEETLARAKQYRDAGADGLFVPKVVESSDIRTIATRAGLPLNVLAWPGLPSASELTALGVRRLSAGSSIAQFALGRAAAAAAAFLGDGSRPPADGGPSFAELNALLSQGR